MSSLLLSDLAAIAQGAGDFLREHRRKGKLLQHVKAGGSMATDGDYISQEALVTMLHPLLAPLPFLVEEDDPQLISQIRDRCPDVEFLSPSRATEETLELPADYVSVDPADGTYLYAAGCPEYSVSISVVRDYRPVMSVIYQPELELLILAERGKGCTLNEEPVRLQPPNTLRESLVGLDVCRSAGDAANERAIRIARACRYVRNLPSVGSGVELLLNRTAAWFTANTRNWDIAATALAVQEAGGVAKTFAGEPLPWNRIKMPPVLFAANEELFAAVQRAAE